MSCITAGLHTLQVCNTPNIREFWPFDRSATKALLGGTSGRRKIKPIYFTNVQKKNSKRIQNHVIKNKRKKTKGFQQQMLLKAVTV